MEICANKAIPMPLPMVVFTIYNNIHVTFELQHDITHLILSGEEHAKPASRRTSNRWPVVFRVTCGGESDSSFFSWANICDGV